MRALRAEKIYKVFGRRADEAVELLEAGKTREDVRALGATAAVIDATFEVEQGEIFVVMGLSGSGKSTLIRMLNGLWEPTAGHIHIGDVELTGLSKSGLRALRQDKISMVFQHFALLPHRTVLDNAAYALEIRQVPRLEREKRAREALAMVDLDKWADQLPGQLSGGMRQRVGLARALAAGTEIMLMDEAFSALDPLIRREMQDQLLELQSELGKTIVFITHDLNEAMRLGDRIAMMRDGEIVQIGTAEDILRDPANDYVAQFVQDVDRTRVLTATAVMERPIATLSDTSGPRQALRTMRENQMSAAFVVNRERKLMGAVREEAVAEAVRADLRTLETIVTTDDLTTVTADTLMADLFAPSAEHRLPLVVVDDAERILGVVPRVTLLAALGAAGGEETTTDTTTDTTADTATDAGPPSTTSSADEIEEGAR